MRTGAILSSLSQEGLGSIGFRAQGRTLKCGSQGFQAFAGFGLEGVARVRLGPDEARPVF